MSDDTQGSLIPLPTPDLALAMDIPEAQQRIARIRAALAGVLDDIIALHRGRAWIAMGYESWDDLCAAEFGQWRLPVPQRQDAVTELTGAGLSTRAIGAALGVDRKTVMKDQRQVVQSGPVDPRPVVGLDGRTRTYEQPEPDPQPGFSKPELDALDMLSSGRSVVVNMSRDAILGGRLWPWAQQQDIAVRIDRKSKWGNPFIVGEDGDRARVIALFTEHYLPYKGLDLSELQGGKVLGCWCAPLDCHGDHLIR